MEIRARYILMGLFLLAVTAGVFGFVYWLENSAGFRERETYRIRFDSSVSGLLNGSAVLFNGIRVGEVQALRISADRPREVAVDISVDVNTPIQDNTMVDLEYQGLTGVAAISLTGSNNGAPLTVREGKVPTLVARSGAGTNLTQAAREALVKLNSILDDNSKPVKSLISNLNDFATALSRNSGKVDGILGGLERMTGGVKGPDSDKVYDVAAPTAFAGDAKPLRGQLAVPLPTAIFQVDTQNIIFRQSETEPPMPAGPRWSDNLTRLLQARVAQSFENAGYGGSVSQSAETTGDFRLLIDIRSFQMIVAPKPEAEVAFSAKVADANGKILASKIFQATKGAPSADTGPAVTAINQAFSSTATDLVAWTADTLTGPPPAPPAPPTPAEQAPAPPPPPAGEAKAPDAPADGAAPVAQ